MSFFFIFGVFPISANIKDQHSLLTLSNGIKIIVSPIPEIQASCILTFHLNGVKDDPVAIKGASFFYRYLMTYESSENLQQGERVFFIKKNGGINHGKIGFDYSYFYQVLPEHELNNALWLEKERMTSLKIPDQSLNRLKNLAYERLYNLKNSNIDFKAKGWIKSQIFENTNYIDLTHENPEIIRNMSNDEIRKIYPIFSQPSKFFFVISGNIKVRELLESASKHFSNLPPAKKEIERKLPSIPPRESFVTKNWLLENISKHALYFGFRAPAMISYDYFFFDFIRIYLFDPRVSQLEKRLNQSYKLNIKITHEFSDYVQCNELIVKLSSTDRGNIEKAKYYFNKELESLRNKDLSNSDIKAIKTVMELDFHKKMANPETRCMLLAQHYYFFGTLDIESHFQKRLNRINPHYIKLTAQKYLNKKNSVILNVYKKDP